MDPTTFTLTENHLKLARHTFIDWDDSCYEGAPAVDIKRPYGNSSQMEDVWTIIYGMDYYTEHPDTSLEEAFPDEYEKCRALHREMATALQIIALHAGQAVSLGAYHKRDRFNDLTWVAL